jgi:hypothetical protein
MANASALAGPPMTLATCGRTACEPLSRTVRSLRPRSGRERGGLAGTITVPDVGAAQSRSTPRPAWHTARDARGGDSRNAPRGALVVAKRHRVLLGGCALKLGRSRQRANVEGIGRQRSVILGALLPIDRVGAVEPGDRGGERFAAGRAHVAGGLAREIAVAVGSRCMVEPIEGERHPS